MQCDASTPKFLVAWSNIALVYGTFFLLLTTVFLLKLVVAMKQKCNFASAIAPMPPRDAFANKIVWISGASSGYGRALALHLCSHHDDVRLILSSRRKSVLDEVAAECRKMGNGSASVKVLSMDLFDHDTLPSKATEALSLFGGRIDVLVNNGGVTTRSMARNATFDVDAYVMNLDFLAYVKLTKLLLPTWESQQTHPIIINTTSVAGKVGVPVRTAYCAAKHAIHGWFDAFRIEQDIIGRQISVLNVVLGSTRTNVARNAISTSPETRFGEDCVDFNIESGLDPNFVVERVVAAAYARHNEIWIAPRKELLVLYLNQYLPESAKKILSKKLAKQYAVEKEEEKTSYESIK